MHMDKMQENVGQRMPSGDPANQVDSLQWGGSTGVDHICISVEEDRGIMRRNYDLYMQIMAFDTSTNHVALNEARRKVREGTEVLRWLVKSTSSFTSNIIPETRAMHALTMGKLLVKLEECCRYAGLDCRTYAARHLGFIARRTRLGYMELAERTDAHPYVILGLEHVRLLIRQTREASMTSQDAIGDLLRKHGLTFDPKNRMNIADFKRDLDVALAMETLEMSGVNVQREVVQEYLRIRGRLDREVIQVLRFIEDGGGDPDEHLILIMTPHWLYNLFPEEGLSIDSFKDYSLKLGASLRYLLENPGSLSKVNAGEVDDLIQQLQALRHEVPSPDPKSLP